MDSLLYLMRHGAAEDVSPTGRDADRALTGAGSAVVRRVALALRGLRGRPLGRIIASPLVRAQQTAEIVRGVLCPQLEIDTDEDLEPEGSAYDLALRLSSMTSDTLLVGHQPNIEMVARAIVAPAERGSHAQSVTMGPQAAPYPGALYAHLPPHFRTATVVAFHVEGRPPPYRLAFAVDSSAV
jgi:phosphohistidine phosphatase SixA